MENRLDFVEQLLKRFYEKLNDADTQWLHLLVTHIITQMTLNATPQKEGFSTLPEIIRINVSPEDEEGIPELKEMLQLSMPDILTQLARERYVVRNEPLVTTHVDDELLKSEMKIIALPLADNVEDTAVLTTEEAPPQKAAVIIRASLLFPDGREFPLENPIINIGRNPENHLILDDPMVSRHHAQIRFINGVHHIFDIQSTSGTYINDTMIEHGILNSGDVIRIANQKLIYINEVSSPSRETLTDVDTQEMN